MAGGGARGSIRRAERASGGDIALCPRHDSRMEAGEKLNTCHFGIYFRRSFRASQAFSSFNQRERGIFFIQTDILQTHT